MYVCGAGKGENDVCFGPGGAGKGENDVCMWGREGGE